MTTDDIIKVVPTLQAVALVGRNAKLVGRKKKKFLSAGVDTIVGSSLIQQESKFLYG